MPRCNRLLDQGLVAHIDAEQLAGLLDVSPNEHEANEQALQAALAAASPEALGEKYYGQCIACHGSRGEGGIGPMLAGQAAADIVAKLTAYRAGEERGAQSAMMYPVAKPMTDADLDNIAAYVASL